MPVDRIFANCTVYTFDRFNTVAEAILCVDGHIKAVGSLAEVRHIAGPDAEEIDLEGCAVVPGLTDAHTHLTQYGLEHVRAADLSGSRSIREVLDRLREFRRKHPDLPWLLGKGFDQELFAERRWITRADLDEISTDFPIMITRLCLHAMVANSAALKAARDQLTDQQAETGILTEDDTALVWQQVPPPSETELENAILWALSQARRVGLSGVHCQIDGFDDLRAVLHLHERDGLPARVRLQCPFSMLDRLRADGMITGWGNDFLSIGSIKLYVDGAMGPRTAALREPYNDDPGNCGVLLMNEKELTDALREIQAAGCQAAIHAIGDRALETALAAIENTLADGNHGNALRHRIEHASVAGPDLIAKMAELRVPAVVQPQFVVTDFWTHERVGPERYRWCYAFRSMIEAGIRLAMGSDCPVERLDPVELIDRAVNRESRSLNERLSAEQTLRAYTLGGAWAGFTEKRSGSIEPGKLADFVALEPDPFRVDVSKMADTRVRYNVIGGLI